MLCVIKINSTRLGHAWHVFCMHFDATPPSLPSSALVYQCVCVCVCCVYAYIVGTCMHTEEFAKTFGICVGSILRWRGSNAFDSAVAGSQSS